LTDETPDPPELPESFDELFAELEAGTLDLETVGEDERERMLGAARLVHRAQASPSPPVELRRLVLDRIRAEQAAEPAGVSDLARARRRRLRARLAVVAAAAVLVVAAVLALTRGQPAQPPVRFDAELAAVHNGPSPAAEGGAEISRLGDGLEVHLEAEGLAPNTGNTTYELWYVARGDSHAKPNRVAIGSFRTSNGTINARWVAAFNTSRFTRVAVTLQPANNGNPSFYGPEVVAGQSLPTPQEQAK
jgi:Anti-sigma-K factor rskA